MKKIKNTTLSEHFQNQIDKIYTIKSAIKKCRYLIQCAVKYVNKEYWYVVNHLGLINIGCVRNVKKWIKVCD